MMESAGMRESFQNLKPFLADKKVTFTRDHDNKTSRIIDEIFDGEVQQALDPIHGVKELKRKAEAYFNSCAEQQYTIKKQEAKSGTQITVMKSAERAVYTFLIQKLVVWFKFLIENFPNIDERVVLWENSGNHFIGNHDKCLHPDDLSKRTVGGPRKEKERYWEWPQGHDPVYFEELMIFLSKTTPF